MWWGGRRAGSDSGRKALPLWCRWQRNQPGFVSDDGLRSRGHWETDTNPEGLCSPGPLIKAVSQYLGCVWMWVPETRSDLSQGTLSLLLLLLLLLPESPLGGTCFWKLKRHIANVHNSNQHRRRDENKSSIHMDPNIPSSGQQRRRRSSLSGWDLQPCASWTIPETHFTVS